MIIITDQNHRVVSVSLVRGIQDLPNGFHCYETDDVPQEGTIYPPYSNTPKLPPMLNLTLSDLIALRQLCFDESMGINVDEKERNKKWHDRFKQVDKELSDRVEKIFAE